MPLPLHHIVSDATGASIVIEYMDGQLSMTDNKVGGITNSPGYDWHLLNLRNYVNLTPRPRSPHSIDGVSLAPFGAGSGMLGSPGDFTPPSRFVRAVAFVNTMIPAKDAADAVNAASVMLNNFDIPKGLVRGVSAEDFHPGYTQWSVIADMSHKVNYHWTMYDRRMRSVDLPKLDFNRQGDLLLPARQGSRGGYSGPLGRLPSLKRARGIDRRGRMSCPRGGHPDFDDSLNSRGAGMTKRPLSFCRREDRPCPSPGRSRPRRARDRSRAVTGKGFRLAAPFTQKDHLAHHILVGQSVAAVLAARDRDLDRVRNISREPYVRAAAGAAPAPTVTAPPEKPSCPDCLRRDRPGS